MVKMVTLLVEILIFTSVIGVMAQSVATTQINNSNVTGASAIMIGLVVLFVVIGFIVVILKQTGLKR